MTGLLVLLDMILLVNCTPLKRNERERTACLCQRKKPCRVGSRALMCLMGHRIESNNGLCLMLRCLWCPVWWEEMGENKEINSSTIELLRRSPSTCGKGASLGNPKEIVTQKMETNQSTPLNRAIHPSNPTASACAPPSAPGASLSKLSLLISRRRCIVRSLV